MSLSELTETECSVMWLALAPFKKEDKIFGVNAEVGQGLC